jgi:transposase
LGQWGTVLEARLFADSGTKQGYRRQVEPDWASIHRELKRKHVTLSILWDEYVERNPEVMDPCVFGAKGRRSSD